MLYPIYKGTYQRHDSLTVDTQDSTAFYRDHVVMWAKDLGRSIDYLETRPEVATDHLAYYGLSWGGAMGGLLPAVEPRIKVSVLVVAGLDFPPARPEVEPLNFLPRIHDPDDHDQRAVRFLLPGRKFPGPDVPPAGHVAGPEAACGRGRQPLRAACPADPGDARLARQVPAVAEAPTATPSTRDQPRARGTGHRPRRHPCERSERGSARGTRDQPHARGTGHAGPLSSLRAPRAGIYSRHPRTILTHAEPATSSAIIPASAASGDLLAAQGIGAPRVVDECCW